MRTFVVGDIHGCYAELQSLLEKAEVTASDVVISVGDIVDRGPDSARAMRFFRGLAPMKTRVLLGNHEYKHIRARQNYAAPTLSILITRWQLGIEYDGAVTFMETLPHYLDLPNAIIAHGYYEPGVPLEAQKWYVLVGTNGSASYLKDNYKRPWWELYDGDLPLIVGHKDMSGKQEPFNYKDRVFGLDTGCVYGGKLTGLWLPDFTFVSVPAENTHWQDQQQQLLPAE